MPEPSPLSPEQSAQPSAKPVPSVPVTLRRLQQLYGLGLGAHALPALLLGLPLGARLHYPPDLTPLLVLVALGCAALSLYLAWRQSREPAQGPQADGRLSAATLLASGAGVPLLLASVLWHSNALLPLLGLAALAWAIAWWWLRLWAQR